MKSHILFLKENEPLDLSHISVESKVIVVVPGEKILLIETELPPLKGARFHQALPFVLEEQLIDDVTQLHFSVGVFRKNQKIPVAIVAKKTLEQWLFILKEANIYPHMLIPDTFVLPLNNNISHNEWQARLNEKTVSIRQGAYQGFSCDTVNLPAILKDSSCESLHIHYAKDQEILLQQLLSQLPFIKIQVTIYSSYDFLQTSYQWLTDFPVINLLQGEYKPVKKSAKNHKWRWIACAFLLTLTGVLLFLSKLISFIILSKEIDTSDKAIRQIYKTYFPNSLTLIAPRMRLQEKLKKLSQDTNQSVFLYLLQLLGNELTQEKSMQLNSFHFANNQLSITLTTSSFNELDHFIKKLQSENLNVKQQKANIIDSKVNATLLIKIQRGIL